MLLRRPTLGLALALAVAGARPGHAAEAPESAAPAAPTPVPRIGFDEAIKRALARNPTVAAALSEIARADALVLEARSGFYPTLSASGSYTRLEDRRPPTGPTALEANEYYGSLNVAVPLVAPQGWTAERHAKDLRRISDASAADVRRLVAQATGNAYLAVIAQRLQLHSNDTAIANAKDHAAYAHTRLVGGIGRSIDDVRAQQDLATVLATRQTVLTGLARAREALGVLIGEAEPVDAIETVDLGVLPTLAAALDDATAHRPDVTGGRE